MAQHTLQHLQQEKADFKTAHQKEIQLLKHFLPYIYRETTNFSDKGRAAFDNTALICWGVMPDRVFQHIRTTLFPDLQLNTERRAEGFNLRSTEGHREYPTWLRSRTRRIFEDLLGPLVLPASSASAQAAMARFAYAHAQAPMHTFQDNAQDTHPAAVRLFDFSGSEYTIFQRITLATSALLRTRIEFSFMRDTQLQWSTLPLILQLLHFVCKLLLTRHQHAFRQTWLTHLVDTLPNASTELSTSPFQQSMHAAIASPHLLNPEISGLNYGVTGHFVVNWTRFMASPLYALFTAHADRDSSSASILKTFIPDRMGTFLQKASQQYDVPNLLMDPVTDRLSFVREVAFSDIVPLPVSTQKLMEAEATARATYAPRVLHKIREDLSSSYCELSFDEAVTVIDPYAFQFKDRIFDVGWHNQRKAKATAAAVRRRSKALANAASSASSPAQALGKLAHVYRFTFRPRDYLSDNFNNPNNPNNSYIWFPSDHVETIYAIRHAQQLYFTRPTLLQQARVDCPSEVEAWTRALDLLRVTERFYEDGSFDNLAEIVEVSKSSYFQNARKTFLEKVAREFIPEFIAIEESGYRELQRIKRHKRQVYMRENPDVTHAGRWYYDYILKQTRPHTDITQIRRIARVILSDTPTTNIAHPVDVHFYSRASIKTFLNIASRTLIGEGPTSGVPTGFVKGDSLETLTHGIGMAPYVTAWAKFCLDMHERGVEFSQDAYQSRTHWSPIEDFVLFQNYSKYPRLNADGWSDLLAQLPNRDTQACRARVCAVNQILKKILGSRRWGQYRVGAMRNNPERAKRAVFMLGLADRITGPRDYLLTQIVQKLTPDRLARIKLPGTYRGNFFTTFAF